MSAPAAAESRTAPLTVGEFFDLVRGGQLAVQRCRGCQALAVPPKAICPACEGMRWDRVPLGGGGEIVSYTVIRVAPGPLAAHAPYAIAVVRMAEGVSLLGRVVGAPLEAIRVGLPVRFVAPDPGPEPPVLAFRPR